MKKKQPQQPPPPAVLLALTAVTADDPEAARRSTQRLVNSEVLNDEAAKDTRGLYLQTTTADCGKKINTAAVAGLSQLQPVYTCAPALQTAVQGQRSLAPVLDAGRRKRKLSSQTSVERWFELGERKMTAELETEVKAILLAKGAEGDKWRKKRGLGAAAALPTKFHVARVVGSSRRKVL